MNKYDYSNGRSLREPWRFTPQPIWQWRESGSVEWLRFVPAKIEFAGVDGYFRGDNND